MSSLVEDTDAPYTPVYMLPPSAQQMYFQWHPDDVREWSAGMTADSESLGGYRWPDIDVDFRTGTWKYGWRQVYPPNPEVGNVTAKSFFEEFLMGKDDTARKNFKEFIREKAPLLKNLREKYTPDVMNSVMREMLRDFAAQDRERNMDELKRFVESMFKYDSQWFEMILVFRPDLRDKLLVLEETESLHSREINSKVFKLIQSPPTKEERSGPVPSDPDLAVLMLKRAQEIMMSVDRQFIVGVAAAWTIRPGAHWDIFLDLLFNELTLTRFNLLPVEMKSDPRFMLAAVKKDADVFQNLPVEFQHDRNFVERAARTNGLVLEYAAKEYSRDKNIVKQAILSGQDLSELTDQKVLDIVNDLRDDLAFMMVYAEIVGYYLFASERVQKDENYIMESLKKHDSNLDELPSQYIYDEDIIMTVVSNHENMLQYVPTQFRRNKKVVLAAVKKYGSNLQYASPELKNDPEVVLAAVKQNGFSLKHADSKLRENIDIVSAAIQQNKRVYREVPLEWTIRFHPAIQLLVDKK